MFRALELENFKAFGKRSRVEFAPITLIYGQNSAGKSSVLNALNLLKQTRMSREQGALLLPRAERGLVDLGSFHELLHDHDADRTLAIRVDLDPPPARRARGEVDEVPAGRGFGVGFRRDANRGEVTLAFLEAYASSQAKPIMRFEPKDLNDRDARAIRMMPSYGYWRGNRRLAPGEIKGAACVEITSDLEFWRPAYRDAHAFRQEVVKAIEFVKEDTVGRAGNQLSLFRRGQPDADAFASATAFYSRDFSLEEFVERRVKAERGALVGLDGFLPMPSRADGSATYPETAALRLTREYRVSRRRELFDATEFIVDAGRMLEIALERLFPLGPFRRAPKRLYIFTGTTPVDVGYSGDLLPDLLFRRKELLAETNMWMGRLEIGYDIHIEPVGTPSNDLFEVRLRDTRRNARTSIALPDVGFGISQILPLIVQTLASEAQTITIEQPEVHIHPRLQADLADLLIAGIQDERRHRFIIETHSEHLVLRLLRRIRETTEGRLDEPQLALRPDQLSVVYLDRGKDGTEVHHLRVDGTGEFIDKWPRGFFEERAAELF